MKLNAKFLTAAALTASVLTLSGVSPVNAMCFNPACLARDAEDVISKGQEVIDRTVNYKVKIRNPTNRHINYAFEGIPQAPLASGYETTFTGATAGAPSISFDNGQHQQVSHGLSRQGSYYFAWQDNTLVLYAD